MQDPSRDVEAFFLAFSGLSWPVCGGFGLGKAVFLPANCANMVHYVGEAGMRLQRQS
jgi:hypothetical protein